MELALFFVAFALLWFLQLYGTARQGQQFMREVSRLRPLGETAIGASTMNRLRRRTYVCLAADESDHVTGAIELDGITIFARALDAPELVGRDLESLARTDADDRRSLAAAMAAQILLGEQPEVRGSERVSSRWASAMQRSRRPTSGAPSEQEGSSRPRLPRSGHDPDDPDGHRS